MANTVKRRVDYVADTPASNGNGSTTKAGSPVRLKSTPRFSPRMQAALSMLVDAATYASDLGVDLWEFAVEISALRRLGLTHSECRWLVGKGLAKHALEVSSTSTSQRVFHHCHNLGFPKGTCFVVTEFGVRRVESENPTDHREAADAYRPGVLDDCVAGGPGDSRTDAPVWDRDRQQLRVGRAIVKEYKVPASNQEAVLAAFEEENWPPRIDDPLAPKVNHDPKRRLHETINSLNRNQKQPLLRFFGDGSGQGVRWEFFDRQAANGAT